MLDVNGTTSEGSYKIDLARVEQIIILAVESGVLLLLNLENDVTSLDSGSLITFATELDLGATADALVNVDVKDLAIDNGFLATALLATVLLADDLTLSAAVRADSLEALDHRTHLAHHSLHTLTITAGALLNSAVLAANTLTLGADDRALKSQLRDLAAVDIFERDLVGMVNGASLRGAALAHATAEHASHTAETTAAAEELSEQVFGSHATTTTGTTLKAGLTILVVNLALLGVGEDFVCVRDLLELALSIRVVGVLIFGRCQRIQGRLNCAGDLIVVRAYQGDT